MVVKDVSYPKSRNVASTVYEINDTSAQDVHSIDGTSLSVKADSGLAGPCTDPHLSQQIYGVVRSDSEQSITDSGRVTLSAIAYAQQPAQSTQKTSDMGFNHISCVVVHDRSGTVSGLPN